MYRRASFSLHVGSLPFPSDHSAALYCSWLHGNLEPIYYNAMERSLHFASLHVRPVAALDALYWLCWRFPSRFPSSWSLTVRLPWGMDCSLPSVLGSQVYPPLLASSAGFCRLSSGPLLSCQVLNQLCHLLKQLFLGFLKLYVCSDSRKS